MRPHEPNSPPLPDIAASATSAAGAIDWVGMAGIELPILLEGSGGQVREVQARVQALVDLADTGQRGIHMSRLYLSVGRWLESGALTPLLLKQVLDEFVESQQGSSRGARLSLAFDLLLRRPALRSGHSGWRSYPVLVAATRHAGEYRLELELRVLYSSTCPASAALARQLIQQQFERDFGQRPLQHAAVLEWLGSERGIVATPHAQRSALQLRVLLHPGQARLPLAELLDLAETALATPVQAAVKREDEQAFALLNGQNAMFCEDAARRIRTALANDPRILDFHARLDHFESLHAHDAVAMISKGVPGGYGDERHSPFVSLA